jgi:hypothetical protein
MNFPRYPAYKPHIKVINKVIKEEQDRRAAKVDGLMPNEQPS